MVQPSTGLPGPHDKVKNNLQWPRLKQVRDTLTNDGQDTESQSPRMRLQENLNIQCIPSLGLAVHQAARSHGFMQHIRIFSALAH
jgi:hypothetical protein